MKTKFEVKSDIQSFVEHTINVAGIEKKDTLYINIDEDKEPKITLIIEDGAIMEEPDRELSFPIESEHFQMIVDWLREKQIIK